MSERVHNSPNLIYSVRTQVVTPLAQELLDMKTVFLSRMVYQT